MILREKRSINDDCQKFNSIVLPQAMGKSFLWLNDIKENPFDVDLKELLSQLVVRANRNRRSCPSEISSIELEIVKS
jgi:hypothetical protein